MVFCLSKQYSWSLTHFFSNILRINSLALLPSTPSTEYINIFISILFWDWLFWLKSLGASRSLWQTWNCFPENKLNLSSKSCLALLRLLKIKANLKCTWNQKPRASKHFYDRSSGVAGIWKMSSVTNLVVLRLYLAQASATRQLLALKC